MNKKIVIIISLIAILVVALVCIIIWIFTSPVVVYVDPKTVEGNVGQDFTISINISNVVDLYGWSFKLRWNTTILDVVNVTENAFLRNRGNTLFVPIINSTAGYVILDCTLIGEIKGVSGNGALATIRFHAKEIGSCNLDLYDTMLLNSLEQEITHTVNDGYFST